MAIIAGDLSQPVPSRVLLLYLFWKRNCGHYWDGFFMGHTYFCYQPSVSKHWITHKAQSLTSGLASFFHHPLLDSRLKGCCSIYAGSMTSIPV